MSEKKPSVVRLLLSWVLTPSIVMLIAPVGRPLIVELRLTPVVDTPGSIVRKFSASRLTSGSCVICVEFNVVAMTVDCVWTISEPPWTTTVSDRLPTSRTALIDVGPLALTGTSGTWKLLKPIRLTVTV